MYEKYYKQFVDNFNLLSQRYDKYRIFLDFLKLASYSMYNVFRKSEEIESKYLNIVKTYRKEELEIFGKIFGELTLMYEYKNEIVDILGEFYMQNKIGNNSLGQFFTPFHIAEFMGKINCGTKEQMEKIIDKNGYITLSEPCCGAGAMILGFVKALKDEDINYQQNLLVYAVDISEICAYMTYVQLSLYGIPAIVFCGDSITQKMNFQLETPFYFMNYWKFRKVNNKTEDISSNEKIITKFNEVTVKGNCQFSLW